jgi:hypothetical protein
MINRPRYAESFVRTKARFPYRSHGLELLGGPGARRPGNTFPDQFQLAARIGPGIQERHLVGHHLPAAESFLQHLHPAPLNDPPLCDALTEPGTQHRKQCSRDR